MKASDPVRPAPYSTAGEPFFDEPGALHLTRYQDVTEVTRRERRGQFSAALSVVRATLAKHGMTAPDPVHIAWLFPWAQGIVGADGSPGRHAALHGVLAEYLGKQAVRDLRPTMMAIAGQLVRENVEQQLAHGGMVGTIDLARFADLLAFRSVSALVGLPRTPADEAFMMSHLAEYSSRADIIEGMRPEAPEVRGYFQQIVDGHDGSGLLGRIIAAHGAGQITLDERDGLIWGCWIAGRDSTATLVVLMFGLVDEAGLVSTMADNLGDAGADWRARAIDEAARFTPFGVSMRTSVEEPGDPAAGPHRPCLVERVQHVLGHEVLAHTVEAGQDLLVGKGLLGTRRREPGLQCRHRDGVHRSGHHGAPVEGSGG